jgi:hypothetical protein
VIKIVLDEDVAVSREVASYLASRITSGGRQVSVLSLDQARSSQSGEGSMAASGPVISLTAQYRPSGNEKIVYWLDESCVDVQTEVPGMFTRFKRLFAGAMNMGALRDARIFVNDADARGGLAAKVANIDILPFPLTRKVPNLPGEYGRTVALELADAGMSDDELHTVLRAADKPGIESLLVYSRSRSLLDHVAGFGERVTAPLKITAERETFEAGLSTSLLYAGVGLGPDCSFQSLSLAAALLRPVVLYRSMIDDRYFVNEVTGFETEDADLLSHLIGMFADGVLSPEWFGESLHLFQMRRYNPDDVLVNALQ